MINPVRILVHLVLKLKVFRHNLKILCHPIYTWLYKKKSILFCRFSPPGHTYPQQKIGLIKCKETAI